MKNLSSRIPSLIIVVLALMGASLQAQPQGGKWDAAGKLPLLVNGHMLFADSLTGYYIGNDTGFVTTDGAMTWQKIHFPANATPGPIALSTPTTNSIISFQQRYDSIVPGVIASLDKGQSWTVVLQDQLPSVKALKMWTPTDGFRIWLDDSYKDFIAVTHDGGKTYSDIRGDSTLHKYTSKLSGSNPLTIRSSWSDSLHCIISVTGKSAKTAYPVLLSSDGGRSWSEHYLKYNNDSTVKLSNPYLLNGSLSAWVIPSTATGQYFYYSNNLGKSWTVTDTLKAGYILQLAPVTPTATWLMMVGNARNPAQSTNVIAYRDIAGSWKYIDTLKRSGSFGSAFTITDLQFIDPYHGWVSATFSSVDSIFFYRYKAPVPVIGVSVQNSQATLRCVPNPARSVVSIEGLSPDEVVESIHIINTNGVEHEPALEMSNSHISVRVNDLANGTYVVNVRTSKRKESISMIVLR